MAKVNYNICNGEDETLDIEEIPEPTPEFKHWVRTLKHFVDTDNQKEIQDMFLTKIDFDKFKKD
jgi:hypothetical protein